MNSDLPRIPPRAPNAHKGSFGHVLVVAGSVGMTGAVSLVGEAALRSGAGLVTIACPRSAWGIIAAQIREAMVRPVGLDDAADWSAAAAIHVEGILQTLGASTPVLAMGPGMGRSEEVRGCVRRIAKAASAPLVLDADGIVAFEGDPEALAARSSPTILTPHPGEARRLVGEFDAYDPAERSAAAREIAVRANAIVVLKGHGTVVTDGVREDVNRTGNPGMATAGAGDVLTGIIAGLVAAGLAPYDAARLGAHVHGLAGDLAAADVGQVSLIAGDILARLPGAIRGYAEDGGREG
jgi:hydroxyethylthiazole kinase-like uncharacterized protein yjeF